VSAIFRQTLTRGLVIRPFVDAVIGAWIDPKYIKFSLYAQQFGVSCCHVSIASFDHKKFAALTHSLLLALSLLPPYDPFLISLSHRSSFLNAMQSYLTHPDPKIRRLGMLVAEVISERTIEEKEDDLQYSQQDELDDLKAGLEVNEELADDRAAKKPRKSVMKRLRFGKDMWEGDGDGREECRWLRTAVSVCDSKAETHDDPTGKAWLLGWDEVAPASFQIPPPSTPVGTARPRTSGRNAKPKVVTSISKPKIVMLDPDQLADPLEGYSAAYPSSSRSASPTPSYLEEVAADPSLALDSTQKKKITRPVYIQQLFTLLKEREKPDYIEMGLKWGEALVRAKRSFGGELGAHDNTPSACVANALKEESAIPVATMAISLNDPFHLDDFEEKRQGLLTALVACSPRVIAPCVQYCFTQGFSTNLI